MFYKFSLATTDSGHRDLDEAGGEDFEEADGLIDEERKRDRRPVGHDWEDG